MPYYILFDTETTGGNEEDRIIQIGAIIVDTKGNYEFFSEFVKAPIEIKIEAMEVHNITPDLIELAPIFQHTKFSSRLNELNHEDNFLIAHNLPFDFAMLQKEGFESKLKEIDTLRCAKHLYDDLPFHRLQYLRYALELYKHEKEEAEKLGVEIKAHDALSDVIIMKLFVSKLVAKAKTKFPDQNPMHVLNALTKKPVLIKEFKFGKHKGKSIEETAFKDKGYLDWMLKNMDLDDDMKYSLNFYLNNK